MLTIAKVIFFTLLISHFAVAAPKAPQMSTAEMESQLYKTVTPMNNEDELSVIVFFKHNCPVCRNYHSILDHWGSTLPKPFIFQFFPVVEGDGANAISPESGLGMLGFWSSEVSGTHSQRNMYAEDMYALYQDRHVKINVNEIASAASSSGLSMSRFEKAWKNELALGSSHLSRQLYYKPVSTPTMVICGKYIITPDNAMGNQDTFIQLANGLLSKCMVEKGLKN